MKKGEKIIILIVALVCLAGCGTNNGKATESVVEESSVKENEINTTEQESVVATTEMESSVDEMGTKCEPMKESDAKDFWIDGNTYLIKMRYVMDGEESFFDSDGTAQIHKEREYKDGLIYNIIINSNDGNVKNRSMAHFYVENEKIYIVDDYDNNKKIKDDYLQLVYQQKDIENDNGKGLYYSIVNIDGITKFKLYTYLVETNYYNNIEWGKESNINFFENGYGAQRDLLQVKFIKKK